MPAETLPPPTLRVAEIDPADHLAFLESRPAASFLQTPAWGRVKAEWRRESVGFLEQGPDGGERLVGVALVLYRQLPKVRRYLAYVPEGPVLDDWDRDLRSVLPPLAAHLKGRGAFAVRIGPPVVLSRWDAKQVKEGVADEAVRRLHDMAPSERSAEGARVVSQLTELGWRAQVAEGGFAAGQPQYVFQVPLTRADGTPRTEDEVLKGMNQLWRRNIKKADKLGVEVACTSGVAETLEALADFHQLYVHTAERDHFTPRPLSYFRTMVEALAGEGEALGQDDRLRIWTARHEGDLVASTISVRVGTHAWYSYGASSTEKRDVRGSNAIQWAMIRDALAHGAHVYDLRGITDTLDADDSHVGLIQFKVGTGGEAVELAGEWDLPLNPLLYKAFDLYMGRR
ncbi:lipid II:glycine glycyltransferase FemX [Nocardioides bruguierae]|uniref:lipid II:glycine glycyltransferase FemX n=1 Tax=Nocardioides bruguierae TaxID=2945102 RepID=UPI0027DFF93B|nr:peptidoglycan bridge formation glycyltransferase FemA/FemB family protein [Nocardioides bruguierae]